MFKRAILLVATALACLPLSLPAEGMKVKITPQLESVQVKHDGEQLTIQRNQNTSNTIHPRFQLTSRKCPPFCIQPMKLADGVETIDEITMLDYLKRASEGDESILIVDSRNPSWLKHGTIPGSINIYYKRLYRKAPEEGVAAILEDHFGAERTPGGQFWNYRRAKTLVLFCNGPWCGQSPTNIKSLLRIGYPPSKIKWYRGGMQDWETLGLTSINVK